MDSLPDELATRRRSILARVARRARQLRRRRFTVVALATALAVSLPIAAVAVSLRDNGVRHIQTFEPFASTSTTEPPTTDSVRTSTPNEILAVGDSVLLGAGDELRETIPGIFVDAKVSRQFRDATVVLQQYRTEGLLPPTIIVQIGTNGAFAESQFDALMAVVGTDRTVYFVNTREPRPWETAVNQELATDARKYSNARLINWHDFGGPHADWFLQDGIHVSPIGAENYARFIKANILGEPAPATTPPTSSP